VSYGGGHWHAHRAGPPARGRTLSEASLARWLRDPAAQEPTRHMPNLDLSEAEASAFAAYLASLR
jgi:cytochrome c1